MSNRLLKPNAPTVPNLLTSVGLHMTTLIALVLGLSYAIIVAVRLSVSRILSSKPASFRDL